LERIKWKPYEISEKSIVVNVPDFRVYYLENQQVISSMAVVTGKKSSPTPIFSDTLEYVIFNPTWGVPNDIARTEMLYKLRKNPNYLANNGYVLTGKVSKAKVDSRQVNWFKVSENNFPYYIMQKPGEKNSLGKVKFIFPNKAQVYLHDTPEHKLFLRKKRAFSHGCIRLECPPTMAFYVLKGVKDWNKVKIDEAMTKKEIRHVVLPKNQKIPVNITYQTAWVNESGQLHLREDIYGHDAEQIK
jgi:murein L,D-transpeptidase YcbB/YkuD